MFARRRRNTGPELPEEATVPGSGSEPSSRRVPEVLDEAHKAVTRTLESTVKPLRSTWEMLNEGPQRQTPHKLVRSVFLKPTYCSVCGGLILMGGSFKCANSDCDLRCHRGIGHNGVEHCKAEALKTACPIVSQGDVKGEYRFGDFTKAIINDFRSSVEEEVVKAVVDKQRKLGKLERVRESQVNIRARWRARGGSKQAFRDITLGSFFLGVVSYAASFCSVMFWSIAFHGAYGTVGADGAPLDSAGSSWLQVDSAKIARFWATATAQAAGNVMTLTLVEFALGVGLRLLSLLLLIKAEIIRTFCAEVITLDLDELEVDVVMYGQVGVRLADRVMGVSMVGFFVAAGIWLHGIAAV